MADEQEGGPSQESPQVESSGEARGEEDEGASEVGKAAVAERPPQTLDDVLARHRKEVKELQAKEMNMKKAAAKGSKAEQKAKKKQVEDTIAKLEREMKARHDREVADQKARLVSDSVVASAAAAAAAAVGTADAVAVAAPGGGSNRVAAVSNGLAAMGLGAAATGSAASAGAAGAAPAATLQRPTKAQKRRSKKAQQEAERERRIEEEKSNVVSEREIEEQQLMSKLIPLGLGLREVKPDGHCLFRAIEDQLRTIAVATTQSAAVGGIASREDGGRMRVADGGVAAVPSFMDLRRMAAEYMRAHVDDFLPFVEAELLDSAGSGNAAAEAAAAEAPTATRPLGGFHAYCDAVEKTAAWGGQLELQALSRSLRKAIVVHCAGVPDVEIGMEEFGGGGGEGGRGGGASAAPASSSAASGFFSSSSGLRETGGGAVLRVTYHRHAYGLGEHYNSVVPLVPAQEDAEEGREDKREGEVVVEGGAYED